MKGLFSLLILAILLSACSSNPKQELGNDPISVVATPTPIVTEMPVEVVLHDLEDTQRDEFSSVMQMASDGISYSRGVTDGVHTINITDWVDNTSRVQLSCYGLALNHGQSFEVSFEISSDIADTVTIQVSNYDEVIHEKNFSVSQRVIHERFIVNDESFYDGKLTIIIGKSSETNSGEIVLSDLKVSSLGSVKVNQIGYLPESSKVAVFTYNAGDTFEVIDVNTNQSVFSGVITGYVDDESTLEKNGIGDFSALSTEGTYKIVTNFGHESFEFQIQKDIYRTVLNDALIALSSQRCGQALSEKVFGPLAHEACHNELADVEVNDTMIDVTGGWHDAGDYGRYICPGVKAVSDLLLAYLLYPEAYGDDMGIMESGNGISDVLDEARVELEWLLKMQRTDSNAFFNSVITEVFAGMISPEQDLMTLYALKQENTATAAASAALALGSIVFKDVDEEFSEQCLDAAKRGFAHAEWQRGSVDLKNPEHFSGGDYANSSDYDELYYAAMSLYIATNEKSYLEHAKTLAESCSLFDFTYDSLAGYGTALYLLYGENSQYKSELLAKYIVDCQKIIDYSNQDGYLTSTSRVYQWSGNMHIGNSAIQLLICSKLVNDTLPFKTVQHQIDYLFGKNAINTSFVSEHGTQSVQKLHNRLTISHQSILPGFVVAGIDRNFENSTLSSLVPKQTADAKAFIDHQESYSNTEVAIYQNSVLIFMLGAFQ